MRDLTAHVTSSLLQFPEVTVQALGEDEITIDSVLHGKFTGGRSGLACLACGPQLEVVSPVTGERLSAYHFSGVTEQPPTILAVKEFSWQKRTGLLIGLEEAEGSVLCLYDLGISRVVKAVVLPGRVTAIEPIINHGGASLTTQHLHQSLRWLFGVAAVVTDVGHVLLIDLCLDDLSCSQNEIEASDLEVITGIPPEIPQIREAITRKGRHLCFQLLNPSGTPVTTLSYIHRSNQLVVGFSDGYLSLWNMKSLKKEYHSQLEGGRIPVYTVTFQEPENDPRNCCYLWAVQSTQESEGDIVSLHLLQLAFSDRRRLASGQIMYEGLEYCEERYSLDLTGGIFSLRGQTSNTKLIGCQTVEKFRSHIDREDGINEVISPDTSVSVFSWQVNTYGQGNPSTYLGIFDINRWYHAQMPDSLRPGEFLNNCPYFALWSLDAVVSMTSPHHILDVLVHERSLSRGVPPSYPPPEQFFNPSTYNFDATCLLNTGVVHVTCTGFQKDTLHFLKKFGGSLNEAIPDSYNRCLVAGLLSPRFIDVQPSSLSQEEQFEAVLSAAIQTSSLGLLTSFIKQWTAEEQPDSAPNLRFVLEWTWNKVVSTKEDFVRLCVPLFDGSSNFIGPQTLQSLQHCELLLSNLSTVLSCFVMEAQELTEKGITDLTNKQVVTSLLSLYVQVVIWFCRSSLLPESLDEDMQLSKPFYNYQHIQHFYAGCRQKLERLSRGKWNPDCLMIDGLISQLGHSVVKLWQRDDGGTGKYPPPTLHALLDLYLLENIEDLYKHATTIYLLLDIMHSCPNKADTSVGSFPTAFAIPIGLVNLIQGFWCLDHNDFENSLTYLFHPATIKLPWQHIRIIQFLMCQGEHRRALRYIQTMKPSLMSNSEVTLHLTVLLFNSCMVEAWSVLRQHSTRLNVEDMLKHVYETCQGLGLMEDLLKLPFTETEQECLEKFLRTSAGVNNHEFLLVHHLQRANYVPALQLNQSLKANLMNDRDPRWRERSVARNSILDQYGKVLPRVQRKLAVERAKPYHLPTSLRREILRPKPLSTVAKKVTAGNVITKATLINNVLSKIGEVWVGTEQKNKSFQNDITEEQPPTVDSCTDTEIPDPFVGTPATKSLRKCSRLLDLVVQPIPLDSPSLRSNLYMSPRASASCMLSSPLHSSPRCSLYKSSRRAPELKLLETPLVVRRAKALTSTSSSGFPGFTPQSILRSSLRTTPLATPTASPGRSITPPLRAKETKISFMEESKASGWTAGMTDSKTKHNTVSSECIIEAHMEDMWSKTRETPAFSICSLQEDYEEAGLSSECVPGNDLNKAEPSKETSYGSVKSDQTTSDYQDAKSPGDNSDSFRISQPAGFSPEDLVNIQVSAERESSEAVARDPSQMEQQTSTDGEQSAGLPEREGEDYGSLPEDEVFVMHHLNAIPDTSVSSIPSNESQTNVLESSMLPLLENNQLLDEATPQALEPLGTDAESVISIPDSEDIVSVHSKNELEEREALDEDGSKEAESEENIAVLQEKTPLNIEPASQEVNLVGDGTREVHISEAVVEALPYNELCPSSSLKYQYSSDAMAQQVTCELLKKDAGESNFTGGDGDLLVSQNNFTLLLEGDEEAEIGDSSALHTSPLKSANQLEGACVNTAGSNNPEFITNTVSTVTSDQISQNTAEVLPYVPEPIQMAIAENLLDVIKDTRSKEFSSEVVDQSFHESISKKVLTSPQAPLQNVTEISKDVKLSQVEDSVMSSTSTVEQMAQNVNDLLPDGQPLGQMDKPDLLLPPTPRRSARRAKETLNIPESLPLASEQEPQEKQTTQVPAFPVLDTKETKECDLEISTNVHPITQEFQATIATRRGVRKPKELASELPKHPSEQLPSSRRRTPRSTRSLVGDQEGSQFIIDHTIQMMVNPKSARKLKSIAFHLAENVISDQEVEPREEQLSTKPRRGRPRKHGELKVMAQSETAAGKLPLPSPVRRGRHRKSSLPEAISEHDIQSSKPQLPVSTEQERARSTSISETVSDQETGLIKQLPVRRRGRPRKNPLNVSADLGLELSLLSPLPTPSQSFVTPRRNTRRGSVQEKTPVDTTKRKSARIASVRIEKTNTSIEKMDAEEHSVQPSEAETLARSSKKRQSKMTAIRKRSQLPSLSEEGTEEEEHLPQAAEIAVGLHSTDMTKQRLSETGKTLAHRGTLVKKTRYSRKSTKQSPTLDTNETFCFSPPLTKLTEKSKGEKAVTPVQLKDFKADLTSQFVFSPPALRSRKKKVSSISRIVEELELPVKEEKDAVSIETPEKPKVKRSRATRSKAKKASKVLEKDSSWSTPHMEIQFISPFGTPVDGAKSKQKQSVDKAEKTVRKTLHRNERITSFPKPIVQKKRL
uniref:AT-hook containing transcription factor 1 n=1 Tax=Podarcis muralis TaxID=64176 RepID=A0A670IEP2_PODMU|nr:protein ELYS isoform X1 [Podarcis muralis]XP_028580004.1 protein ELYS isoform X1 [Podarcis muralis]